MRCCSGNRAAVVFSSPAFRNQGQFLPFSRIPRFSSVPFGSGPARRRNSPPAETTTSSNLLYTNLERCSLGPGPFLAVPIGEATQMKQVRQNLLAPAVLMMLLGFAIPIQIAAQTFTPLYHFTRGTDGASPQAGLILSGGVLYGTAYSGGGSSQGTVFKINSNGTGFTTLHSFAGGSDGANPSAGLMLLSNSLYGTTVRWGSSNAGSVFKVSVNGTGFSNLYSFTGGSGGANPLAGFILSDNTLYGTAYHSSPGYGIVFAVNIDGTGFTNLYSFLGAGDGANPQATLVLSSNTLYGTTQIAGLWSAGTVFAINTDGTGFNTLYSFSGGDGANPSAGLTLSGNTLFGTTKNGGNQGAGTIFSITTEGAYFTSLYSFAGANDGANPSAGLIVSGNTLYGTTAGGGVWGNGTVFAISTDGTGFKTMHGFTATTGTFSVNSDGANPLAGLVMSGNVLYGTASAGGRYGDGTLFSLTVPLPPQLTIVASMPNVILTWPTNFTGFTLQSTTNLLSPSVWAPVSPPPVVFNGQYWVTNAISGWQQFYRLVQ